MSLVMGELRYRLIIGAEAPGAAGARYAEVDSRNGRLQGVQRKRSYYWSVLGDWTLRLRRFGD